MNSLNELMDLFREHNIKYTLRQDSMKHILFKGTNGIEYELCFFADDYFKEFDMMFKTMSGSVEGHDLYYEFMDDMFYITISSSDDNLNSFILGTLETNREIPRREYMLFGDNPHKGIQMPLYQSEKTK